MTHTRSNTSDVQKCTLCSVIPSDLLINTGRGETFPTEVGQLLRLDLGNSNDIYRCPICDALFEWADLPQYYGSGNNDEERLTRLNPDQASTVQRLLDPEPGERDCEALLERALRILSRDIVCDILRRVAVRHKQAFSGFAKPILDRLMAENDGTLFDVVASYADTDRDRLSEVLRLLDAGHTDLSGSASYLRKTCLDRLARLDQKNRDQSAGRDPEHP